MKNPIEIAFKRIADDIINNMKSDIQSSGRVDTGRVLNGFQFKVEDRKLTITNEADYAGAVDQGRGPATKAGDDLKSALMSWIQRKNISLKDYGERTEEKRLRSAAFLMAKSINEGKYMKNSGGVADFSGKTLTRLQDRISQQLGDAYMSYLGEEIEVIIRKYTDK